MQTAFELEEKDKLIEKQKIELQKQKIQISELKHELQQLKSKTDVKLELKEKMIEKLKIELEVYITEIKKKMNVWRKKQESQTENNQTNSNITSPTEMSNDTQKIQIHLKSGFEIKDENNPVIIEKSETTPVQVDKLELLNTQNVIATNCSMHSENKELDIVNFKCDNFDFNCDIADFKCDIDEFDMEQDSQPREHASEIKIENELRNDTEEDEIKTFPIGTILASGLENEPSETVSSENKMIVKSREPISEVKLENQITQKAEAAESTYYVTDNSSNIKIIEKSHQKNVSIKKSKPLFECKVCFKAFEYKSRLKIHFNMVHDKIKPFECKICSLTFCQRSDLNKHTDLSHNNMRPFECKACSKAFGNKKDLKRHIDTVHEKLKPFTCQICLFTFGHIGHLNIHIESVHKNVRHFKCSICTKAFRDNAGVKRHIETVHKMLQ